MTIRIPNHITRINVKEDPLGARAVAQSYNVYRMYYDEGLKRFQRRKRRERKTMTDFSGVGLLF